MALQLFVVVLICITSGPGWQAEAEKVVVLLCTCFASACQPGPEVMQIRTMTENCTVTTYCGRQNQLQSVKEASALNTLLLSDSSMCRITRCSAWI